MALLKCGHTFCFGCLETLLRQDECKCPICRAVIDGTSEDSGAASRPSSYSGDSAASAPPPAPASSQATPPDNSGLSHERGGVTWRARSVPERIQSCAQSFSTAQQQYPSQPSSMGEGQSVFSNHAQEIRFRMDRMHHLYPDAMSLELLRAMNSAINRNSYTDFHQGISERAQQIHRTLQVARQSTSSGARRSGSHGSRSSTFGGGSSRGGGGGGGRW